MIFLVFRGFPKQIYYWFTTYEKLDYLLRHDNKKWLQFTYLNVIQFLLYNEAKKGRWRLWEERKLTCILTARKENYCYIVLWNWKISLFNRADIPTPLTNSFSRLSTLLLREWKLNISKTHWNWAAYSYWFLRVSGFFAFSGTVT